MQRLVRALSSRFTIAPKLPSPSPFSAPATQAKYGRRETLQQPPARSLYTTLVHISIKHYNTDILHYMVFIYMDTGERGFSSYFILQHDASSYLVYLCKINLFLVKKPDSKKNPVVTWNVEQLFGLFVFDIIRRCWSLNKLKV